MSRWQKLQDKIGKKPSTIKLTPDGDYEMKVSKVEFKTIEAKATGKKYKLLQVEGTTTNTTDASGAVVALRNNVSVFIPESMPARYFEYIDADYGKFQPQGEEKWVDFMGYESFEKGMLVLLHKYAGYTPEQTGALCEQMYAGMDDIAFATQLTQAINNGITAKGGTVKFDNEQYEAKTGEMKQRQSLLLPEHAIETQIIE